MLKPKDNNQEKDQAKVRQEEASQRALTERLKQDLPLQHQAATTATGYSVNANTVSASQYEALLAAGREDLNQGRASTALKLAKALIDMYPARWEAYELAAQSAVRLSDFALTEKMYESARSLAPAEARPNVEQERDQFRRLGLGALVLILKGKVTMVDGSPPPTSVGIERVCRGYGSAPGPITDKKGEFSWRMDVDPMRTRSCSLHATLKGYTSNSIDISGLNTYNSELPPLVLTPTVTAP
jgi:hypothetical protein